MNWHNRGDVLEAECRRWIQTKWVSSQIIETKINSIHGIDFAAEDEIGDIRIIEVKSSSGSLSEKQFTIEWIRDRIGSELYAAICRCVVRRRYIIRALIRVKEQDDGRFTFNYGSPTGQLTWEELFPGKPLPSLEVNNKSVSQAGNKIYVKHKMSGFNVNQIHIYDILSNNVSAGLQRSIFEQATFPFIVPHGHTIIQNNIEIYHRKFDEWDAHLSESTTTYQGSALQGRCGSCGEVYFHFENEEYCSNCFIDRREYIISEKRDIIRDAEILSTSNNWKETGDKFKFLMERWKKSGSSGKENEDYLWKLFQSKQQTFFDRRQRHFEEQERLRAESRRTKQKLVDEARHLAQSSDWKATGEQQRELMKRWRDAGAAGRDHDDALWQEFQAVRQTFFDRQKRHFEEQERLRAESRRTKQKLVDEARHLAQSSDWKATGEQQRELMKRWRDAGAAGRDHDDALWQEFQAVRQTFFDRQKRHFEEQERLRAESRRTKQKLVDEARHLAQSSDWKATGEQQRELMKRWRDAGAAGRDHDDALWQEFQAVRQTFFDRQKRHFEEQERLREESARAKRSLISEAESLSYSNDWKGTSQEFRNLQSQWKEIGPAGRDLDNQLWSEFNVARQRFFDRQREYFEERDRARNQRR